MPTYQVTSPEGKTYRVTAPAGATQSQILQFAQQQAAAAPPPKAAPQPQREKTNALGAFVRGAAKFGLLNFNDEIAGGGRAVANMLGLTDDPSISAAYQRGREVYNEKQQADAEDHPVASTVGKAGGLVLGAGLPVARVAQAANRFTRAGIGAASGAAYGGAAAAGAANPGERLAAVPGGAAAGAVVGAALPVAAPYLARVAAPLIERVEPYVAPVINRITGQPQDAGRSAVNAMARRMGTFNPAQIQQRVVESRAAEVPPTLADVVGPRGRRIIQKAGEGSDEAGAALTGRAQDIANEAPERVQDQARRLIGGGAETVEQAGTRLRQERAPLSDAAYNAVRHDPLPPSPEVDQILASPDSQGFIKDAIKLTRDPRDKAALRDYVTHVRTPPPPVPPQLQGLSPAAQQQAMKQLGLTTPPPPPYTVGMAQKLNQALRDAAEGARRAGSHNLAGNYTSLRRVIDTHAGDNSAGYVAAQGQHAELSRPIDALETGANFMTGDPRRATVDVAQDMAANRVNPATDLPQRTAARQAVQEAAGASPGAAVRTAEKLAGTVTSQAQRSTAALGAHQADDLRTAMGLEAARVGNAAAVTPRGQAPNLVGDEAVATVASATGHPIWAVRAGMSVLARAGMRQQDAEELARIALDPARTNEAVAHLANFMSRRQAGIIVNRVRRAAANVGGAVAGDNGSQQ